MKAENLERNFASLCDIGRRTTIRRKYFNKGTYTLQVQDAPYRRDNPERVRSHARVLAALLHRGVRGFNPRGHCTFGGCHWHCRVGLIESSVSPYLHAQSRLVAGQVFVPVSIWLANLSTTSAKSAGVNVLVSSMLVSSMSTTVPEKFHSVRVVGSAEVRRRTVRRGVEEITVRRCVRVEWSVLRVLKDEPNVHLI